MKYARFSVLSCLVMLTLVAGCATGVATEKSQAQWQVVIPQKVFAEKLRIAAFLNEDFGVTGGAGDIGKADYTVDGGKTWATADTSGG
jgi:hypothetical protein